MLTNVIVGAVLEMIGAIIMTYNLAQGFRENIAWSGMGAAVMLGGLILLYSSFRPVVM